MALMKTSRIYYGWYIIGACFVILGMAAGVASTFSVFFKPLIAELNCSRTALSGAISINLIIGGLVSPFWGNWTDRSGARMVVITGASLTGICFLLVSRITALWHVYLFFTLEAIFIAGISLIPMSTVVSHWFRRKRGTAMGIALTGEGLGSLIMAPLSNYLITLNGWRNAYLYIAGMIWIVVLPVAGFVLRRRPEDMGLSPDGDPPYSQESAMEGAASFGGVQETDRVGGLTLKQAARRLSFWMIATAFFLPMMALVGVTTHLVAIFTDMGMSSLSASTCLGLLAAISIIGRFGFGYAADRFGARGVYTFCYAVETLGVCTLMATPYLGTRALYAFVVVYGLTFGGGFSLAPLIVAECFGVKSFGAVFGALAIAGTLGGAVGPVLSGMIYDRTGNYTLAFIIFSVALVIATIAISQARSPLTKGVVSASLERS